MEPEIIIDGYNLIHRTPELRRWVDTDLEKARNGLIFRLREFSRGKHIRVTVVFDGNFVGQPSSAVQGNLEIRYAMPPRDADSEIKLLLQKRSNTQNITVVSSDKSVRDFARSCRANTVSSEEFARKYLAIENKFGQESGRTSMSKEELEEWLRLFGEKDGTQ